MNTPGCSSYFLKRYASTYPKSRFKHKEIGRSFINKETSNFSMVFKIISASLKILIIV